MTDFCPCGSGQSYTQCCRRWHDGKAAPTAEALMRSRYSAYVLRDVAYLHRSWHASTRPGKKSLLQLPATDWLGLEVLRTEQGGVEDSSGIVEFIARYREAGQEQSLHETSRFVREGGRWYYVAAV
ncbi:MAG: YchJ family protein [Thiolinea sp.]